VLSWTDIKQALLAMRSLGWISFEDERIPAMVDAITLELDDPKHTDGTSKYRIGEENRGGT